MISILESSREKPYNVDFVPHKRTSLLVKPIDSTVVYASDKSSAKELAQAVVRDYYEYECGYSFKNADGMTKEYKYVITLEKGIE